MRGGQPSGEVHDASCCLNNMPAGRAVSSTPAMQGLAALPVALPSAHMMQRAMPAAQVRQ